MLAALSVGLTRSRVQEMGTMYNRDGLRHLLTMHVSKGSKHLETEGTLTRDEHTLLAGAASHCTTCSQPLARCDPSQPPVHKRPRVVVACSA